jgi:hypothetical protein
MIFLYVFLGLWIVMSIAFLVYVVSLKKKSTELSAQITEKLFYDNIFGQRFTWVISFKDETDIKRLFNTLYKSSKSAPEVGEMVSILKINVFGRIRYITKLQINSLLILPVLMIIIPTILLVDALL